MDDFNLNLMGKTMHALFSYREITKFFQVVNYTFSVALCIISSIILVSLFNMNEETAVETAAVLILKGKCKRNP